MAYKIQELVESGYDFSTLYADKQSAVRDNTGLDFNLANVVKFLQKQTNNFTIENSVAHDLDNAIFKIVSMYSEELKEKAEEAKGKGDSEKTEEEIKQDVMSAIELLEMLGDDIDEQTREALETLKTIYI